MHDLNDALDELRRVIPYAHSPSVRKLSKIATLLLAKNYIQMQVGLASPSDSLSGPLDSLLVRFQMPLRFFLREPKVIGRLAPLAVRRSNDRRTEEILINRFISKLNLRPIRPPFWSQKVLFVQIRCCWLNSAARTVCKQRPTRAIHHQISWTNLPKRAIAALF